MVKCYLKNMAWLRRIHILLATETQEPGWMAQLRKENDRIKVHLHSEFIPSMYLPCFTSPTIEMFLHRIPGLSEQFIYANDDMFPLSALAESDFFHDGIPCQHFTEKAFPESPNVFQRKCLIQQNMIARPFGLHFTKTWLKNGHSLQPILLSTCREVWKRHESEILRHLSPARRTERSYNQYIYALYQHFAGLNFDHVPKRKYVGPSVTIEQMADIIRNPDSGIICLNDNESIKDWQARAEVARREINLRLETET